ncbi:Class III cytochrome C family protein [Candidatus Electrothrix laxa]
MKKALILGIVLTLVCGAGLSVSTAQEEAPANQGPEVIKITDGTEESMHPAYFPHWDHQNRLKDFEDGKGRKSCAICHHGKSTDGKQIEYAEIKTKAETEAEIIKEKSQKCNTCHNKKDNGITLEGKISGISLPLTSPIQRAGHGRCAGCHKDQTSTATPPVNLMMCTTCHNKYKGKEDE